MRSFIFGIITGLLVTHCTTGVETYTIPVPAPAPIPTPAVTPTPLNTKYFATVSKTFAANKLYNTDITNTYGINLPAQLHFLSLRKHFQKSHKGRITVKINLDIYCYETILGTKSFQFKGRPIDATCQTATVFDHTPVTGLSIESLELIFHKSAHTWKMSTDIKIEAYPATDLIIENW